ncbi:kinesin-domain-containing protein [Cutaneotrichosporon oleaginosum]|uniref:Kinesin-domain-containing protein n=1 Tax=Cutaneotrichosporon oleaginosum TaxID=879819 RepID=A0A0J0XNU5_9TREE|nr:kinesin-domain-containing protein [Cutaneotrichosporon oleaginosum]KLT42795.1 kinesin-domain-containing protein [Cutaneotrichosporon oleaginosum]TXT08237.1 hypothetical protein COLE_05161 [Cutaneotrichosporon oleaginosum]
MSAPRASTRTRQTQASAIPTGRVTRLRSQQGTAAPSPAGLGKPGFLAKGKEGLRKVSDKLKEKQEKDKQEKETKKAADTYTEQLQAYLRIRPQLEAESGTPYLEVQDGTSVLMRPPVESRLHMPKPSQLYSFNRVFGPDTEQNNFFNETTKPLVEKLLQGENGLLFAYGVSNSGKTYTIQGGDSSKLEERGLLPRSVDVVFNSIKGLESKENLKCQGLANVVLTDEDDGIDLHSLPFEPEARLNDSVKVDRNFSYAVFVSYVEVYNDKIFDLLDAVLPSTRPKVPSATPRASALPRSSAMPRNMSTIGLSGHINSSMSLAALANGGAGILKRRALVLKNDPDGNGKYICGAHEIRVRTREEALAVFRCGQGARQVFGTMANRESSRSHGIFTIKVVRVHNGAPEDPDSASVSRLAIVDLAGSERTRNTATTGDRLKEAGNINKSLMVLGQCLEVLRANQQRIAAPCPPGARKKLAIVPFRHSKLTEIFQNFFVGDGRAVMMIHVNPYDTGFDENSHVMRFSAIAREIQTTATHKTTIPALKRQISSHLSAFRSAMGGGQRIKVMVPVVAKLPEALVSEAPPTPAASAPPVIPTRTSSARVAGSRPSARGATAAVSASTRSTRTHTRPAPSPPQAPSPAPEPEQIKMIEEELEVVEEDAEDESDDEQDLLVEYLFEQLRELKTQLFESEMRNAQLEVDIREEVSRDLQNTIRRIHAEYEKRLQAAAAAAELKADMKLDIVQRTMGDVGDSSVDESFESSTDGDLTMDFLSDPFLSAPIRKPNDGSTSEREVEEEISMIFHNSGDVSGSVDEDDEGGVTESESEEEEPVEGRSMLSNAAGSDTEMEDGNDSEEEEPIELRPITPTDETPTPTATTPTGAQAEHSGEIDSDEELNSSDEEGTVEDTSMVSMCTSADSEEGEEDVSGDGYDDEDESEGGSDEEDDDFDASFASSVSAESEPARRASRRSPVKVQAPAKPAPLRESRRQVTYNEDEDLMKPATPAQAKKKRTLGKRIVTEDEMAAREPAGGAEVRRMVRGL